MIPEHLSPEERLAAAFHDYRIYSFEIKPSPQYDVPSPSDRWVRLLESSEDGVRLLNTLTKLRQYLGLKMCFDDCVDHMERGSIYDEIAEKYGHDVHAEIAANNKLRGGKVIGIYRVLENLSGNLKSFQLNAIAVEAEAVFNEVLALFEGRSYDEISEDREELYQFIVAYDQLIIRILTAFA